MMKQSISSLSFGLDIESEWDVCEKSNRRSPAIKTEIEQCWEPHYSWAPPSLPGSLWHGWICRTWLLHRLSIVEVVSPQSIKGKTGGEFIPQFYPTLYCRASWHFRPFHSQLPTFHSWVSSKPKLAELFKDERPRRGYSHAKSKVPSWFRRDPFVRWARQKPKAFISTSFKRTPSKSRRANNTEVVA